MKLNKNLNRASKIIMTMGISLFIIFSAILLSLNLKPLYYVNIDLLNIAETSGLSEEVIRENYDYTIDYLRGVKDKDFNLPSLKYSREGKIHFEDVKNIFVAIHYGWFLTGLLSIFSIIYIVKNKKFKLLDYSGNFLIATIIIPALAIMIDPEGSFLIFHKVMFSNDYWIFDPYKDEIINILPEKFFYQEGALIIFIIIFFAITFKLIKKKYIKKV